MNPTEINNALVIDLFLDILNAVKQAHGEKLLSILGHQGTQDRLDRALDILTREEMYVIQPSKDGDIFTVVNKLGGSDTEYVVDLTEKTCTCPDAERGNICKHRLACEVLTNAAEKWGRK